MPLYSPREAAVLLRVKEYVIRELIADKKIETVGVTERRLIPHTEVIRLLNAEEHHARAS